MFSPLIQCSFYKNAAILSFFPRLCYNSLSL